MFNCILYDTNTGDQIDRFTSQKDNPSAAFIEAHEYFTAVHSDEPDFPDYDFYLVPLGKKVG